MIFKLYTAHFDGSLALDDPVVQERTRWYVNYWRDHHVKLIGFWRDLEDPQQAYYMTAYKNQEHYETFVEFAKLDPVYQKKQEPHVGKIVSIKLSEYKQSTLITLSQDNNPTEKAVEHSEKNWTMFLNGLKKVVEG